MRPHETDSGQRSDRADRVTGTDPASHVVSRRSFLQASTLAGASAALTSWSSASAQDADSALSVDHQGDREIAYASIAELQSRMASGRLTSRELVEIYLQRIRFLDEKLDLRTVLQLNPDAPRIASELDRERRAKGTRGPLHGIPVLLKDNIDTADAMQTTAGSLALAGAPALQDATVARRLRKAGAVILGKTNLSE
jgi:amidase